ncbi:MAG: GFA family protein [Pseudomonadota bacterium]
MTETPQITGRCYCGTITFRATAAPQAVTYCHCEACRRATGGPVAAFAAFAEGDLAFDPDEGRVIEATPGVRRSFCGHCGSSLTGRYDYLPGQVYLSLGVIDQAAALAPTMHSHAESRLPWLHIDDGLERHAGSARSHLSPEGGG